MPPLLFFHRTLQSLICPSRKIAPAGTKLSVEDGRQLPYGERAELSAQLIADTAKDPDPKVEKTWGDEALRRLEEIESGKVKLIPGAEVMARARKIIGRQ